MVTSPTTARLPGRYRVVDATTVNGYPALGTTSGIGFARNAKPIPRITAKNIRKSGQCLGVDSGTQREQEEITNATEAHAVSVFPNSSKR